MNTPSKNNHVVEPGAPLKRPRNASQNNEPGMPRQRLFRRAVFLDNDEDESRSRAIQKILNEGKIGDEVEGMYQAQGKTEIYRISGPTNNDPTVHLEHVRSIQNFGGKRRKSRKSRALKKRTRKHRK